MTSFSASFSARSSSSGGILDSLLHLGAQLALHEREKLVDHVRGQVFAIDERNLEDRAGLGTLHDLSEGAARYLGAGVRHEFGHDRVIAVLDNRVRDHFRDRAAACDGADLLLVAGLGHRDKVCIVQHGAPAEHLARNLVLVHREAADQHHRGVGVVGQAGSQVLAHGDIHAGRHLADDLAEMALFGFRAVVGVVQKDVRHLAQQLAALVARGFPGEINQTVQA